MKWLWVALGLVWVWQACGYYEQITSLPGLESMPTSYSQYGGYVTVNATSGSAFYYWFVESQNDPATDPVVLWLQGGPGCSGLLAFWQENGPFQLQPDGSVTENPLSWNRYANVIYVESPAAVGFSYSNSSSGYVTNDNLTAADNYQFLQGWYEDFPNFASNPLWLTGESYAGVYIPTLAYQILEGSNTAISNVFQGFMLGNPVIRCPVWVKYYRTVLVNNFYWHGLASHASWTKWFNQSCDKDTTSVACDELWAKIEKAIGPYDPDDMYYNFCTGNATLNFIESVPDCYSLDILLEAYMNRLDVQDAIHARPPVNGNWEYCSDLDSYTQLDQNMLNYYNYFFLNAPSWRILIYSGDVDIATVPHPYTQLCLSELQRPVQQAWKRWTIPGPKIPGNPDADDITAGYQEIYDTYAYATVRGAAHQVPTVQPNFALAMFERFVINGQYL